ncbi:AraC family transcriptional regulator [Aestuariibacter halophilus]|uniref:AraC family transcriptional regulator n=1 Tax=Fluctibacter halophilus TaxID=226011 RepID=A0ABS8G6L4_9ALTE|nr:AraC family transcriptional regulator [Aestuariibacter halophilus]MCC2616229.1 AraC family transcriptional regulator [Aestuariibacter halophilus]
MQNRLVSYSQLGIIPAASFATLDFALLMPDPALRRWVQCLWSSPTANNPTMLEEKFYADGGSSLTFTITPWGAHAHYYHQTRTSKQTWDMSVSRISVRFRPGAAAALLGLDVGELANIDIDLASMPLRQKVGLTALLDTLPELSQHTRLEAVQDWLIALSRDQQPPSPKWRLLLEHAATHLIAPQELAAEHGVSRRSLERYARKQLGFTPNQLHGFAQIRQARQRLITTTDSLADIALACGYYDQAHFTNAFRQQTLETPLHYRRRKVSQISNQ